MSYVLEALKKAQAQREQGGLPGIHSMQVPYVAVEGKARPNPTPVLWAIAGLLVVILGGVAWRMGDGLGAPQEPVSAVQVATGSVSPPPAATPLDPVLAAPPRESEPIAISLPQGESQLAGPVTSELPAAQRAEKAKANVQSKDVRPKIYAVSELPEGVRRELPNLVISGGSYSSNPAQRLIILNNQVFTEKSEPATGVVVERIEQNAVVLRFRDYSYRVRY